MADGGEMCKPVQVALMHQLSEARCADDDWTGLRDQRERRRRQTRLALRAYRKRKATQKDPQVADTLRGVLKPEAKLAPEARISSDEKPPFPPVRSFFIPPYLADSGHVVPARYLYPISRDHLLPLVAYNVYRATITNILILDHLHLLYSSCGFGQPIPVFPNPYEGDSLPVSLKPTPLQQSVAYPGWIDLFPSPRMRDNAIRTQHLFTNRQLCADILGGLMGDGNEGDYGLVAWSNPWEPDGWELTESFIKKWWFLIEGCTDLLRSTNRWRALRGEERLTRKEE